MTTPGEEGLYVTFRRRPGYDHDHRSYDGSCVAQGYAPTFTDVALDRLFNYRNILPEEAEEPALSTHRVTKPNCRKNCNHEKFICCGTVSFKLMGAAGLFDRPRHNSRRMYNNARKQSQLRRSTHDSKCICYSIKPSSSDLEEDVLSPYIGIYTLTFTNKSVELPPLYCDCCGCENVRAEIAQQVRNRLKIKPKTLTDDVLGLYNALNRLFYVKPVKEKEEAESRPMICAPLVLDSDSANWIVLQAHFRIAELIYRQTVYQVLRLYARATTAVSWSRYNIYDCGSRIPSC